MSTYAMHTDEILGALQTIIGTAVVTHSEGFPDEWPSDAELPAAYYEAEDFIDTPDSLTEDKCTQTYEVQIFIVALKDAAHDRAYGRHIAEDVRNKIKANRTLGLSGGYWAHPQRVTKENPLEAFLVEQNQPRQARMVRVIVNKSEDES